MAINTSTAPLILSLLLTLSLAATAAHHAAAPPPADCSTVILNLADCLSYVTDGSTVTKPEGKCCSGLKTVLKSNPECLCEGFKNSAQLGITLNVTKALDLPSACHVSAPSVSNCGLSLVPGAAPAIAPIGAVSPSSIASPPTTSVVGANELAPAPAPRTTSDCTGLAISVGSLLVALMVSMLSFI